MRLTRRSAADEIVEPVRVELSGVGELAWPDVQPVRLDSVDVVLDAENVETGSRQAETEPSGSGEQVDRAKFSRRHELHV